MENIKKSCKNNKFKISAPTWNEEFELPDESYSISDIQDYFEHILKKHGEKTVNISIRIYINKIENRITFKIKTRYYFELLTPETMSLLRSTKSKIITEVILIHYTIVHNSYQQKSTVLYTLVPNKSFGQLLHISTKSFTFSKTFHSEVSYIEVWFTDLNSNPLEIKDKINITLIIN